MKRSNVIQNIGWREKKPECEQNNDFMQQLKKLAADKKRITKGPENAQSLSSSLPQLIKSITTNNLFIVVMVMKQNKPIPSLG